MAEELSVQQGTEGGPDTALPQGAASEVNANLTETTSPTGETISAPSESGGTETAAGAEDMSEPELAQASDYEPIHDPENEDDAFISGETTRPDEPITAGAYGRSPQTLSPELAAAMPLFMEAAALPDAPPQLRALMALLAQDAGN